MTGDRCVLCGEHTLSERIVPLDVAHDGQSRIVQDRRTVCNSCDNVSYIGQQISAHQRAVASAIREMDGLLSAEALQQIRAKYRFKQTDMEAMLSTGSKTWTRWERGKIPQSKAADKLIRLIAEDPYVARRLMEQAGIDNPDATAIFLRIDEAAKSIGRALARAELRRLEGGNSDEIADRVADAAFETARVAHRQVVAFTEAA